jgi:hypothetical protein
LHPSENWTSRKLNRTSRYAKKDRYFSNSALKVEICPYMYLNCTEISRRVETRKKPRGKLSFQRIFEKGKHLMIAG